MITVITLTALMTLLVATWYFAFYRNNRVHAFRKSLIDQVFRSEYNWQERHMIYHNGPGYAKMLYSFKPLRLESFYTPAEIEILNK